MQCDTLVPVCVRPTGGTLIPTGGTLIPIGGTLKLIPGLSTCDPRRLLRPYCVSNGRRCGNVDRPIADVTPCGGVKCGNISCLGMSEGLGLWSSMRGFRSRPLLNKLIGT